MIMKIVIYSNVLVFFSLFSSSSNSLIVSAIAKSSINVRISLKVNYNRLL